jgi:hypothetical protein
MRIEFRGMGSVQLDKRKDSMGRLNKFNLHQILPLFFLSISSPHPALSLNMALCPAEWSSYVTAVKSIIGSGSAPLNVLFADRSGKIYECLKSGLSPEFIQRAEFFSRSLPHDRDGNISPDPSQWPQNICRVSESRLDGIVYLTVNLPFDPNVLETPVCFRMVTESSFFVLPDD